MKGPYSAPIPELPRDWQAIALGEVCNIENGCPFESRYFNEHEGLPLVRVRDVNAGVSKTLYSGPYENRYLVENGDLLVGMDGEFHVRKWTAGKALLNQRVCRLMPDVNRLDKSFLAYAIRAPLSHIEAHTPYTTVKHISARQILAIPLPYPPLQEQRQIATLLSAVQWAIELQERLIALTAEFKKTLMHKLFTEGTRGEPLKQTEIGPVPESWRVLPIRQECVDCAFGPRFSSKEYVPDGRITTLRTTDMDDDGNIDYTHAPRANLGPTRFASHFLRMGDIVVSRSGTCGIASVFEGYDRPVLPGAFLIRLRMRDAVWPQYLRHYLNSAQGRARTALIAQGAIQKNISGTRLQGLLVPLPPHEDQVEIAGAIDSIARVAAVNQKRKGALEGLFRTLLHQLMTAQIRVHDLDLSALEEAAEPVRAA
jgi:type I restriction enzyme, S subunit